MVDSSSLDALTGLPLSPAVVPGASGSLIQVEALHRELLALYHSHLGRVVGYFKRCGCSESLASDLAQDTFLLALRGLIGFDGRSKLSTWLWAIARNVFIGHLRTRRPDEATDTQRDPDGLSLGDDANLIAMQDCVRRGFAAFAQAHPERAQVVYLAVVEGWSRVQLSQHLGRSVHASTVYLAECKAKLRPYLKDCDGI